MTATTVPPIRAAGIALADPRRLPAWGQALLALLASRVLFSFVAWRCSVLAGWHANGTHWTYLQIANNWDGTWYQRISLQGYPAHLPHDVAGTVEANTWAFYPLYPGIVRLVEWTGLSWAAAATVVSLLCSAAAAVLIRSLAARVAGPRAGLWTVAFFCFFPSALVLQLPYSESLAIMLLAAVLWCLQRGRYVVAVPALVLVGLARPIGVPLAGVLTVHLLAEARAALGLPRGVVVRRIAGPLLAWGAGVLSAVEWPLIAWWRTGVRDAYTSTMAAWRSPHVLIPVQPWLDAAELYLGRHAGPAALVVVLAGLGWWLSGQGRRTAGRDLAVWCGCYVAYLLAVLDSFTSLPRYLLPLFPLGTMLAASSKSRAFRLAVTGAFGILGVVWMLVIWRSHQWAP